MPDWELRRTAPGGIASIRVRGAELLAGEAGPCDPEAAPWNVMLGPDHVRVEPARFELAQRMVWPFRHEPDMELVVRGTTTALSLETVHELKPAFSVRLEWPSSGVAVSIAWDEVRLPVGALVLRSNPSRVELTIGPGIARSVRQVSWWVQVRDGSGVRTIEVVDYDAAWPAQFQEEQAEVRRALGDVVAAIEHGGSTAVPGLAAKPIIDMWAALRVPLREEDVQAMAAIGYEYLGESALEDQDFFVKRAPRVCHLHCYPAGHPEFDRHLAYRDWLRTHPVGAAAYARLKRGLADRFAADRLAYTEAKSDFIEEALGPLDSAPPRMAETALPPADLLPVRREATPVYRLVRLIGVPILQLVFRFDVQGKENIPRSGNYIAIANHLNWLDEFALLLLFPVEPRIHFLADPTGLVKRKVQWFLVRQTGGYVPVVRERHGDQALFRHVDRALEVGAAVAIFPEGNYGPVEGELMPFKKGFAHFAIKAGVPVVPVGLSGTKDLWFRKRIKVVIGKPILPAGHTPESLTEAAYERIKELLPAYREAPGRKLLRKWLTNLF